jgi:hemerythrin-like domain-containing protein
MNVRMCWVRIFLAGFISTASFCAPAEKELFDVEPIEDLMREHGLLNRLLLIYEEIIHRIDSNRPFDHNDLKSAVTIMKTFIEEYHEKDEEEFIFPLFKQAKKHVRLVDTLLEQHEAGRKITKEVLNIINSHETLSKKNKKKIANLLKKFVRMYRVHEAREDTVLYPALHFMMSKKEYEEMGEKFEQKEKERFGEGGFEHVLAQVAAIEKSLGIYNLAQFTPSL